MTLAHIVPSIDPQHGGPSVSVPSLARALAETGNRTLLLSTHPTKEGHNIQGNLECHSFLRPWPSFVCRSPGLANYLRNKPVDILHSHGLWLRTTHYAASQARERKIPHVISPRGMLNSWALNHHRWKKQLASAFLHPGALKSATAWHATAEQEADDIRALGFTQPICVAPNGVDLPTDAEIAAEKTYWHEQCPETLKQPIALFYSRFHRKKRVLELIDIWVKYAPKDWFLLMVGIPQEYSIEQLRDYVIRSSGSGRVGIYDGSDCPAPYAVASLFLLPSHSENFGLVVTEALAHGIPVVATDTTPWARLNETEHGWCGSWELFQDAMVSSLKLGPGVLRERGAQAVGWVAKEYSWQKSAKLLAEFYGTLR